MKQIITNRNVLIVTGKRPYRDWLLTFNRVADDVTQLKGYYLIDSSITQDEQALTIRAVFKDVFETEISDYVTDKSKWPDTSDFEVFSEFFDYKVGCLMGDLGSQIFSCEVSEVNH